VPNYLLFATYGLLALAVLVCLVYIAKSFEDEDPKWKAHDAIHAATNARASRTSARLHLQ